MPHPGLNQSSLSGVIGSERTRFPVALETALAMAAAVPNLPDALHAGGIDVRILLLDEEQLDRRDVRVRGQVIVGEVAGRDAPEVLVVDGVLLQSHPDAPHHAAHELAAREPRVQDPPAGEDTDQPLDPHVAEVGIDQHFDELRTEGVQ